MKKIVHNSYEAEQSILGAMLQDFGAWEASQPLKAEHFYTHAHGRIYLAISKVVSNDKRPDPVIVAASLGDELEECGGIEYLQALMASVFSSHNVARHSAIVRDFFKERQLLAASEEVRTIVEQNITIDEKVDSAARLFEGLGQSTIRKMPRHILEIAIDRTQHYQDVEAGKVIPGWTTRMPSLDSALTGGLKPGKLVILAARPGVGKSSFSWQTAMCMASQGLPTLFLSMEMPDEEIADRAVSNMAHINYQALLTGKLSRDGWASAAEALEEMRGRPIYVDDQPALTLTDIKTKARSIPGLKVLIVDYLQLMSGDGENRNSEIEAISRGLKALAKELDICVIALSQLNRQVEQRTNKRPNLSDLRDSGAIEQDADMVLFLYPARDLPSGHKLIGLVVAKNRQGRQCDIALDFDGNIQCWYESTECLSYELPAKKYAKGMPE